MGPEEFREGIHQFLDKYKFKNAVTQAELITVFFRMLWKKEFSNLNFNIIKMDFDIVTPIFTIFLLSF